MRSMKTSPHYGPVFAQRYIFPHRYYDVHERRFTAAAPPLLQEQVSPEQPPHEDAPHQ